MPIRTNVLHWVRRVVCARADVTALFIHHLQPRAISARKLQLYALVADSHVSNAVMGQTVRSARVGGWTNLYQDRPERSLVVIRQCKYLNNIAEQDHRAVKRITRSYRASKTFVVRKSS